MKTKSNKANEPKTCCLRCGNVITGVVYGSKHGNGLCYDCFGELERAETAKTSSLNRAGNFPTWSSY